MKMLKTSLIAPTIALALSINLFAQDTYTIQSKTLKEALQIISKQSKLPYIVDESLIENKIAGDIKDIEDVQKALNKVLKNTKLEALIKNKTIIIRKKVKVKTSNSSNLGEVNIIEKSNNVTEGSGSYSIESMNTSTKLNLSIRDTPQSIVVVTNQEIRDKNIHDFKALADNVPGIRAPRWATDRLYLRSRGFMVDYYQIDGVPTVYSGDTGEENLIIYDRIEIVKGANGLTTGAGNPSASINMVRKHANAKEFKGELNLKKGSWNAHTASIDLSIPLNEEGSIRSRFIIQKEDKESYLNFYNKKRDTFYGVIDADVTDQTKVSIGASYTKSDVKGSNQAGVPIFFSDGSLTNFSPSDSFTSKDASHVKKTISYFTNLEHVLLNDIKIHANYTYNESNGNRDVFSAWGYPDTKPGLDKNTGLGLEGWEFLSISKTKTHSIDLYSSIPFELGNQDHEFIIGSSYSKSKESNSGTGGVGSTIQESVYSWDGNIKKAKYVEVDAPSSTTIKQSAIYAVGKLNLQDNLKLVAGARISNYKYSDMGPWAGDPYEVKNIITPYAGLIYDLNENHSAYVSYTSIFQPQDNKNINNEILDPREGNNFEVGLKGEYFDKKLNNSITYFKIQQDNVAENTGEFIPGTNKESAYRQIKGVSSKGIEIMAKGEINDNWNIDFALSRFTKKDKDGNRINTLTPKTEFSLSSKYKFDKLSIAGGVSWQDAIYTDVKHPAGDTEKVTQEAFYLANIMANYEYNKNLTLQLNIDNLFDKEYHSNMPYSEVYTFGDPRNVTAQVNYKF